MRCIVGKIRRALLAPLQVPSSLLHLQKRSSNQTALFNKETKPSSCFSLSREFQFPASLSTPHNYSNKPITSSHRVRRYPNPPASHSPWLLILSLSSSPE